MRQKIPSWWRDVDRSICLGIMKFEFVIARLEALLVGTSNKKTAKLNSRKWENLLAEAQAARERITQSLALFSSRRRDAIDFGLTPPSNRKLAARARAASARFRAVVGLAQERINRIRDELRQLVKPRNRPGVSAPPSQIDFHV